MKWIIPAIMGSTLYDTDAKAFIDAAGITDATHKRAINQLVMSAKKNGWWSLCLAIYPFVGGTATTHKYNLKNPADSDAAFRISFSGSWSHSSTGITATVGSDTASTFIVPNTHMTINDTHVSTYSRTNVAQNAEDIGADQSATQRLCITIKFSDNSYYGDHYTATGGQRTTFTNEASTGYYLDTRTTSTNHVAYKNGIVRHTATSADTGSLPTVALYVAGSNGVGISPRECAFATIGSGISGTIAPLMYYDIQAFQTALGRQV